VIVSDYDDGVGTFLTRGNSTFVDVSERLERFLRSCLPRPRRWILGL